LDLFNVFDNDLTILLSVYPSIRLSTYPSILLSLWSPFILLSFYPSILLSLGSPIILLTVYPSIRLSLWSPIILLSFYPSIRLSFYPYGLPLSFFWSEYQATGCPFKLLFEQTHRGSKKKRHSQGLSFASNSIWEIFLSVQNFQIKTSSIRNVWIKSLHEDWKVWYLKSPCILTQYSQLIFPEPRTRIYSNYSSERVIIKFLSCKIAFLFFDLCFLLMFIRIL